jgi:hypothetical protein
MPTVEERRAEFKRIDRWLYRLSNERPLIFDFLVMASALLILALAGLMRDVLDWIARR